MIAAWQAPSLSALLIGACLLSAGGPGGAAAQNPYARTDYGTEADPLHVLTTDIDGDGNVDIAASSQATSTTPGGVTLLLNDGTGTFSEAADSPLSADDAYGLAAADVDGSGEVGLAVANRGPDTITLLFNDGSTSFASEILGGRRPVSSNPSRRGRRRF